MRFAISNFIDIVSCTLQIMKRLTLNRIAFLLHHTLLNLFQPCCFTFGNHSLSPEGTLNTRVMLKAKYLDNPGAKTECTALTFLLISWYIFSKKSQPKVHPDITISCYRTIFQPCENIETKFIHVSAQLFWCNSDQTAFVIEGRNVRLHVASDETSC